ncbi:MAG: gamma-glutamyltransferase [Candidatus Hermodarchaeota archaeon]
MSKDFKWKFPYPSKRMPILAKNIVATSQPLASQAGLQMILKGGNAIDAILASAIALTVVEPTNNGIGSDAFAILWDGKKLVGLNASGKSPAAWTPEYFAKYNKMPQFGWDATTVPGAVSAWVELSKKYGQLSFKELFEPAIKYARDGFLVSPITAELWNPLSRIYKKFPEFCNAFLRNGKAPKPGDLFKFPAQARTLKIIADTEGQDFYHGELAKKIVNHAKNTGGLMILEDLENHRLMWVNPIKIKYKDVELHEIPPNGQGLAALIMLGILKNFDISSYNPDSVESIHTQLEAMKLALADAHRYISDLSTLEFDPKSFLESEYLKKRANLIDLKKAQNFNHGVPKRSDTVYLTTADDNGMMVSFIQSNYFGFGSGIVIPDTGISLQNRGACFTLEENHPNQVGPNKRPYHTIIPAFVTRNNEPLMSFGVMGGAFQPMGHVQMMVRIFEYQQNPQTAIDAPRWQIKDGLNVSVEPGFNEHTVEGLKTLGHNVSKSHFVEFGGAQLVYRLESGYFAASEPRKDGQAVGF